MKVQAGHGVAVVLLYCNVSLYTQRVEMSELDRFAHLSLSQGKPSNSNVVDKPRWHNGMNQLSSVLVSNQK